MKTCLVQLTGRSINICKFYILLSLFVIQALTGAPRGLHEIRNYTPEEYNAYSQNWAVVQATNGMIYVGNNYGILEYDGANWQLIKISNETAIRSLHADSSGNVWVGGQGEIGVLRANADGNMQYTPLLVSGQNEAPKFADIYTIIKKNGSIYFQSSRNLIILTDDNWQFLKPSQRFGRLFKTKEHLFIYEYGKGIHFLYNDSIRFFPGSEIFANTKVSSIIQVNEKLYVFSGKKRYRISQSMKSFTLMQMDQKIDTVQRAIWLTNTNYVALGCLGSGVYIIDEGGNIIDEFNRERGLNNNYAHNLLYDSHNGLWIATDYGVSRIQYPATLLFYDSKFDLNSVILHMSESNGQMFFGTTSGILYVDDDEKKKFKKYEGIYDQTRDFEIVDNSVIGCNRRGLYEHRNGKSKRIPIETNGYAFAIERLEKNSPYFLVGTINGLMVIEKTKKNGWKEKKRFKDQNYIALNIRKVQNEFWVTTYRNGILRIKNPLTNTVITKYGSDKGLQSLIDIFPFVAMDTLYVCSKKGLSYFDNTNDSFKTIYLGSAKESQRNITRGVAHNQEGIVLAFDDDKTVRHYTRVSHNHFVEKHIFYNLESYGFKHSIYQDLSGVFWISCDKALVRYNISKKRKFTQKLEAHIRLVESKNDSVLFRGKTKILKRERSFPYRLNSLDFHFVSSERQDEDQVQFSTMLDGYDDKWSNWQKITKVNYNNLNEGDYIFKVKAKNKRQQLSNIAAFHFHISPPFYRSIAAYILYFLALILLIYAAVKLRLRKIELEKIKLEEIIENKSDIIKETQSRLFQSEKMAALGELVAGVAHEINTPVGVGVTASSQLKENTNSMRNLFTDENISVEELDQYIDSTNEISDILMTNLNRAAQLIQSFKQVAVDQSSDEIRKFDLKAYIQEVVLSLDPQIKRTNHRVEVSGSGKLEVTSYAGAISQIISNFILNSIQHGYKDQERGLINIELSKENSNINITYKDDGSGIPEEYQNKIFNPFFTTARGAGGSGLGLHIVYNLVTQKLKGKIAYKGHPGEGVKFIISLPREI
jgi:signal transduction histidine kinase/ligand-binding sensor domain-containing protein